MLGVIFRRRGGTPRLQPDFYRFLLADFEADFFAAGREPAFFAGFFPALVLAADALAALLAAARAGLAVFLADVFAFGLAAAVFAFGLAAVFAFFAAAGFEGLAAFLGAAGRAGRAAGPLSGAGSPGFLCSLTPPVAGGLGSYPETSSWSILVSVSESASDS